MFLEQVEHEIIGKLVGLALDVITISLLVKADAIGHRHCRLSAENRYVTDAS